MKFSFEPDLGAHASAPRGALARVLVTGSDGMLGRAVVERFATRHEVVPLRRSDCDLADAGDTAGAIAARAPRHVVHCAAWTDVDGCEANPERAWRDNAAATRNVALASQAAGASLVYISTDYVFDGTKSDPYREDDPVSPLNVYGQSKRAGEEHVLREARQAFVVRTSWLYGPGGKNFVRTMAALLGERDEVQVVNDQTGSPTYTGDLAAALLHLVESDQYGLYHLANSGTCTWYELARAIAARTGSRCRVRPCTSAEYPRPARRPRNSVLEPYRWKQQGWPLPRPWTEALEDYLQILSREASAGKHEERGGGRP